MGVMVSMTLVLIGVVVLVCQNDQKGRWKLWLLIALGVIMELIYVIGKIWAGNNT